jgi:hypothetical protein
MEAKKEKTASPEEKLLKVIQDSGKGSPARADAGQENAPAKPGLKLAKIGDKPVEAAAEKKRPSVVAAVPLSASDRKGGSGFSVGLVNRVLGAIAAVFILLTGLQIVAAIQSDRNVGGGSSLSAPKAVLPEVQTNLQSKSDFRIFDSLPESRTTTTTNTVTTLTVPWQVYLKDHFDLKGFGSPGEAILFDKNANKMHVLKVGQKLTVADREVILTKIGTEDVELSDGRQSMVVK